MTIGAIQNLIAEASGIGQAIVQQLLQEGCNVAYCARSITAGQFDSLCIGGQKAVGTELDVTNAKAQADWVAATVKTFGRIDLVVANGMSLHLVCVDGC